MTKLQLLKDKVAPLLQPSDCSLVFEEFLFFKLDSLSTMNTFQLIGLFDYLSCYWTNSANSLVVVANMSFFKTDRALADQISRHP